MPQPKMKFRKGARKEHRQLQKQKRHAQSVRYLEWQQSGHSSGKKIQKRKGSINMRGINGQMNRIFTQLDIYGRLELKTQPHDNNHNFKNFQGSRNDADGDDSSADFGDRLERAYNDSDVTKKLDVKESHEDRISRLLQENEAENKEIAKLEKLLYLNKRKNNNMPKSFVEEGLDFILELVDKKYKKRYNDDMELLEEQGELGNALVGDHQEKDNEGKYEDSSADELTRQNEKRRKIKFANQPSNESEQRESDSEVGISDSESGEELGVESEEDSEDADIVDSDNEEGFDEKDSVDETDSKDNRSSDDGEYKEDVTMEELKALRNTNSAGIKISENIKVKYPTRTTKQQIEESADDVMRNLKAMRKGKGGLLSDAADTTNASKRRRVVEKTEHTDYEDNSSEFSEKEASDEDDLKDDGNEQNLELDYSDEFGNETVEEKERNDSDSESIVADHFIRKRNKVAADGTYEDIYGRKRSAQGDVVDSVNQKYVPPAKRLAMGCANNDNNKIELEKLQKHVKGQLNRLSETNLRPIASQISELYSKHSKNNVTSILSIVISDAVFGLSLTPERLVLEPALLCALLHANEGHEVGAQILEDVVDRLRSLLQDKEERVKGKRLENVLRFLCYLFLFKVVGHSIIYGVLNRLDPTSEHDAKLILAALKTCGFALRKCDPVALKELIISLQSKCRDSSSSSQHRFMLNTLFALKNNNISKISNCDPSLSERALKSLRACLNKGAVLQELHVTLEDLYDARMKGKWWLVGSAWTKEQTENENGSNKGSTQAAICVVDELSSKISDLARKAGMNTDIRRAIFGIIMSSEDYLDASERLLRLNLTYVQQRELCYVLLLCAGNEKSFNPYYAHLALFFCNKHKKEFSMTLQCAIWDAIKAIGSYSENKVTNLARFTALLVYRRGLPLSVLKNVEFVDLSNNKVIRFLRVLLLNVLLNLKSEDVSVLFAKIALAGPKLELLKQGLGIFLKRFLLSNMHLDDAQMKKVKKNIEAAEEGLSTQIEKSEVDIFE